MLYRFRVDHIIPLVYDLACSLDKTMALEVINPCKRVALCHVSFHSHIGYTILRNETSRAKTATKVADTGDKYSRTVV